MRLNPDCIRDILLYLEENIDSERVCVSFSNIVKDLPAYDENTLHYHIDQIKKSYLIDKVSYGGNKPNLIFDLSPRGHEFLANIRSNTNWNKTKEIAKSVGSTSLSAVTDIAAAVISDLITKQFTAM